MARATLPNEMCALVGGTTTPLAATMLLGVKNSAASPTRFALDGGEMLAAELRIEESSFEVVAIAHSHPASQAIPSVTDVVDASLYDPTNSLIHVIVSMQGFAPAVMAWRFSGDQTTRVATYVTLSSSCSP